MYYTTYRILCRGRIYKIILFYRISVDDCNSDYDNNSNEKKKNQKSIIYVHARAIGDGGRIPMYYKLRKLMTAVCAAVSRGELPIVFEGVRLAISEYHENDGRSWCRGTFTTTK